MGFDVWHHGKSGIGAPGLPPIHSELALFSLGSVTIDGTLVADGVPIHVMTVEQGLLPGVLALEIGDVRTRTLGIPNGHLLIMWNTYDLESNAHSIKKMRYAIGMTAILAGLAGLAWLIRRDKKYFRK